jgi:cell shape-determining protein MreD
VTARALLCAAALIVIAAVLQVTIFTRFGFGDARVELVVLTTVAIALLLGSMVGAGVGFVGGVLVASLAFTGPGIFALLGTLIGYIAGRWGDALVADDHPVPPLIASCIAMAAFLVGQGLLGFLLIPGVGPVSYSTSEIFFGVALNTVLAVPVYSCVRFAMRMAVSSGEGRAAL